MSGIEVVRELCGGAVRTRKAPRVCGRGPNNLRFWQHDALEVAVLVNRFFGAVYTNETVLEYSLSFRKASSLMLACGGRTAMSFSFVLFPLHLGEEKELRFLRVSARGLHICCE